LNEPASTQFILKILPLIEKKVNSQKNFMSNFPFFSCFKSWHNSLLFFCHPLAYTVPSLAPYGQACRQAVGKPKQTTQEGTGKLLSENL
jgi:hypothetical protein